MRPEWHAYASWIVSAVVIRRFIEKDADETTFVPLSTEYMKKHVPANVYRPLLDDLLDAKVLECDWHYYFGSYLALQRGFAEVW